MRKAMNLPNLPNNPFKKTKAQQLDAALKKLISDAEKVQSILGTVKGENRHTLNLKLCLEDTKVISQHIRDKLNKPKEEQDAQESD